MDQPNSEQQIAQGIADQVSKGLVSYERAKKQLAQMGALPGNTIDIGNVIEWLDKIKKIGYEAESDENGIVQQIDHSGYYSGSNDDGANMIEAARQNAIETKERPFLREGVALNMADLAQAQNKVIDVSARIAALNQRAEDELGVSDAE